MTRALLTGTLALALALSGCSGSGGGGTNSSGATGGADPGDLAQLVVTNVALGLTTVAPGETLLVGESVQNVGAADASSFRVGTYLSTDPEFDLLDLPLGSRTLAGLPAGVSSTGGGDVEIPHDTAPGTWWVLVVADDQQQVDEGDESDNVARPVDPIEVLVVPLPNLTSTEATNATPVVVGGETISVTDTVLNEGLLAADSFRVGVYLSLDDVITTDDTLLGFRSLVQVAVAESNTATGELTVPVSVTPGVYRVGVLVDDLNQVGESNEADNARLASGTVTVLPAPSAQLVAESISFSPAIVDVGAEILVSESVRNDGEVASPAFTLGIYLSQDPLVTEEDTLIGVRTIASLAPGESNSVTDVPLPIPTTQAAGTWFVGLIADLGDVVPEGDEVDNVASALGTLEVTVPPLPDIVPVSITAAPTVIQADLLEPVDFDITVENAGVAAAGFFRIGVYLSTNPVLGPEDTLLDVRQVAALGVGDQTNFTGSATLPSGIQPGTYFIGVRVDDTSTLAELSEGNNVLLAPGSVDVVAAPTPLPDLKTTLVALDDTLVEPGDTVILTTRVENEGTLSASPFATGVYLSLDEVIDGTDLLIAERQNITGLGIGFSAVVAGPITLPADLPVGTYRLGCWADHLGAIVEADEEDNIFLATGTVVVTVPPPPAPDLEVEAFGFTGTTFAAGAELTFDETVANSGELASGPFRVGVYLSDDDTITTDDTLIGWRDGLDLSAAQSSTASTTITLPLDLTPGTYHLGAIVDDLDLVAEGDETNNTRVAETTLEVL